MYKYTKIYSGGVPELKENAKATHSEISKEIGISEKTVSRIIKKLKDNGIIKRVEANKNGHWEILK